MEVKAKRVRYLCSRRSTLELETLLRSFFDARWEGLTEEEKEGFERLVALEDPVLEGIFFRGESPPPGVDVELVKLVSSSIE